MVTQLYTPWWWVRLEGLPKWEAGRYIALLLLPSEGGGGVRSGVGNPSLLSQSRDLSAAHHSI